MRRLAYLALAALGLASMGPSLAAIVRDAPYPDLDYCAPFIEEAMSRKSGACTGADPQPFLPTQASINSRALYGSILSNNSVRDAEKGLAVSPAAGYAVLSDLCYTVSGYSNFTDAVTYIGQVAAQARNARLVPVKWQLTTRPDIVSYPELAIAGFLQSWLVGTSTPFANVSSFITGDGGSLCGAPGGCTFPMKYGSTQHYVSNYIDALGSANDYKTKVLYLPHIGPSYSCTGSCAQNPYPIGVLADLSNASYRAWKVARLKAAWDVVKGSADTFELVWKGSQYMCRSNGSGNSQFHVTEQWLGGNYKSVCSGNSTTMADMDHWYANQDTPWSAQPTSYTWTNYVQGYKAFTDALITAGVPYSIRIDLAPWWLEASYPTACNNASPVRCWDGNRISGAGGDNCGGVNGVPCQFYDDPSTSTHDENADVLAIFRGAKRVFYDTPVNAYDIGAEPSMLADMAQHGVAVVKWDTSCGKVSQ